ncbi:UDP-glycosyltransferase 85C1-like protein [Tanacetum coccineum]
MDSSLKIGEKKPHVVIIPNPAQSHIKCMLKLARLLHHKGISITFINTQSNHKRLVKSGGTHWLEDRPGFQFKTVPDGLPSVTDEDVEHTQTVAELWTYIGNTFCDSFLDIVSSLELPVTCIICDGFMTYTNMIYTAEKLGVPIVLFWTMAACGFMGFYQAKVLTEKGLIPLKGKGFSVSQLPKLKTKAKNHDVLFYNNLTLNFADESYLDVEIDWIPGMEGIRLRDLPEFNLGFKYLLETALAADKVSHIIIHTFEELEASLVKHIKSVFPNVYTVGPLQLLLNQISEKETKKSAFNGYSLWKEEPECIQWLKSKEPNTVLYVNFGSLAEMSLQHLLEFGWGLVNSNHTFLWIIRSNLVVEGTQQVLPLELKEAVDKKGFIASWCSQEEVLNHPSVGGFLTHGGWGSIIESLSAGVPMICCPFSGDQRINCRQMCKDWEVGMEIERDVKRDQVEKLAKLLMEGAEGEKMRKKAVQWKKMAETATGPKGSSSLDTEKLANLIINF